MPEFEYQGVDKAGKRVKGRIEAPSEGDVRMTLRGQGIRPQRITKSGVMNRDLGNLFSGGGKSVSLETLVSFTRQLQALISSGIPIVQAMEILSDQTEDKNFKFTLQSIREKVSQGSYFWEALSAYPKTFPKIYIALMRAGEASGAVDQMLKRLSRYLEDADRLKKTIKSAMMYPAIVITIAVGVIAIMLIFVIPKFEELLTSSGQELPGPTAFVIWLSHFFVDRIVYIVVGGTIGGYLILRFAKSPEGRAFIDRALFKAPLFGNIMKKGGTARFSRSMQTLLSSGVNLMDAIDICQTTINNAVLEDAVGKIRVEIESGKTMGSTIGRLNVFPSMAVQMISVGESTGNLDKMLEKVADFYEEEVELLVQGLTRLMEPILIVFLGGTVGGLLIAMYLPIFKIGGAMGG